MDERKEARERGRPAISPIQRELLSRILMTKEFCDLIRQEHSLANHVKFYVIHDKDTLFFLEFK